MAGEGLALFGIDDLKLGASRSVRFREEVREERYGTQPKYLGNPFVFDFSSHDNTVT
ncbi:MAG: hypothetical protein HY998_07300 [candidate division NC10 bacterium]|nr:hypothetical protein [candidate division NC10 bacterium]